MMAGETTTLLTYLTRDVNLSPPHTDVHIDDIHTHHITMVANTFMWQFEVTWHTLLVDIDNIYELILFE